MNVKKVMSKVIVADQNISLRECSKIMSEKNSSCIVLKSKNKIVGIITEKDIARNINKGSTKVRDIMTKNVITIEADGNLENAAKLMTKHKIKKLPVIDGRGVLIGIITGKDLIEHTDEISDSFIIE